MDIVVDGLQANPMLIHAIETIVGAVGQPRKRTWLHDHPELLEEVLALLQKAHWKQMQRPRCEPPRTPLNLFRDENPLETYLHDIHKAIIPHPGGSNPRPMSEDTRLLYEELRLPTASEERVSELLELFDSLQCSSPTLTKFSHQIQDTLSSRSPLATPTGTAKRPSDPEEQLRSEIPGQSPASSTGDLDQSEKSSNGEAAVSSSRLRRNVQPTGTPEQSSSLERQYPNEDQWSGILQEQEQDTDASQSSTIPLIEDQKAQSPFDLFVPVATSLIDQSRAIDRLQQDSLQESVPDRTIEHHAPSINVSEEQMRSVFLGLIPSSQVPIPDPNTELSINGSEHSINTSDHSTPSFIDPADADHEIDTTHTTQEWENANVQRAVSVSSGTSVSHLSTGSLRSSVEGSTVPVGEISPPDCVPAEDEVPSPAPIIATGTLSIPKDVHVPFSIMNVCDVPPPIIPRITKRDLATIDEKVIRRSLADVFLPPRPRASLKDAHLRPSNDINPYTLTQQDLGEKEVIRLRKIKKAQERRSNGNYHFFIASRDWGT